MPFPAPTIIESVQILCIVRQLSILCSSRNYEFHFSGKTTETLNFIRKRQ